MFCLSHEERRTHTQGVSGLYVESAAAFFWFTLPSYTQRQSGNLRKTNLEEIIRLKLSPICNALPKLTQRLQRDRTGKKWAELGGTRRQVGGNDDNASPGVLLRRAACASG